MLPVVAFGVIFGGGVARPARPGRVMRNPTLYYGLSSFPWAHLSGKDVPSQSIGRRVSPKGIEYIISQNPESRKKNEIPSNRTLEGCNLYSVACFGVQL